MRKMLKVVAISQLLREIRVTHRAGFHQRGWVYAAGRTSQENKLANFTTKYSLRVGLSWS